MIRINCDLCGKIEDVLNRTLIEGVELSVCQACSRFGRVIEILRKPVLKETAKKFDVKEEKIELLVEDYAVIIKRKRESMGLTQKDFASRISEKETTIHRIETGDLEPSLALAKKLEKMIGVKLIEEHHEKFENFKKPKEGGFTLGDFIKIKK